MRKVQKGMQKKHCIYSRRTPNRKFKTKNMLSVNKAATKRSRASTEQLSGMVDFFAENPGLAGGKFQQLHGKLELQKKWEEMAVRLNAMGGGEKSADQWRTVWRDLKSRTSNRVRDRKRQQALTGNKPINQAPLTELEHRVVAIIGSHYIEGHESVVDNVPMEEELQLALEDGEELIVTEICPESPVQCTWDTPKSPAQKTPRRSLKRKREEDESEVQMKYLEIAQKQADAMQMLAEGFTRLVEVQATSSSFIQALGEGMTNCADAINNLAKALGPQ